jgi:very-short-patch-repair endonuclease
MSETWAPCACCGQEFLLRKKWQRDNFRQGRNVYCSEKCRRTVVSHRAAQHMAALNHTYASQRMKRNNPMHKEASRQKMQATLRARGHTPKIRGGNGTGPTQAQNILAEALGWQMEYVIKTHLPKNNALHAATNYKVDIANPTLMIAIEVDGRSHQTLARKSQDRKKEQLLSGLGWRILRFTNQEILDHLHECVQTVTSTISK